MAFTVNTKTYTPDSFQSNAVGYVGPWKTFQVKDDLILRRTSPRPSASFSGVGRASAKLTRTMTLTGALTPTGDGILNFDVSIPVGAATASIDALIDDMAAYCASAQFKAQVKQQLISFS